MSPERVVSSKRLSFPKFKPSRTLLYIRHRANALNIAFCLFCFALSYLTIHRSISMYMGSRKWANAPITYIERACPEPGYETFHAEETDPAVLQQKVGRICITTLTDHKSKGWFQRMMRWRNYDSVLDLTWKNKENYAKKHGYGLYDGSDLIVTSRPPAWTKIVAMQHLLEHEDCRWVVWTDADAVFMNSDIRIESILPTDQQHDLILAEDEPNSGYNSGVLLFRNTPWSKQFLEDWWNMKSYVRPPGLSLSGDNTAMKAQLKSMTDFDDHVLVPPRCHINSFAKFVPVGQEETIAKNMDEQHWYKLKNNYYHKGDLIAHVAGYDNKAETLLLLLKEAH